MWRYNMENYRYNSAWNEFVEAVDKLVELLKQGKVEFCIGIKRDFGLERMEPIDIDDTLYDIICDEVLYLIYEDLTEGLDEEELRSYLVKQELDEKEIKDNILLLKNKMEYVQDAIINKELKNRFNLKKGSLLNKISSLKCNLCEFALKPDEKVGHYIVQIGTRKELPSFSGEKISDFMIGINSEEAINFICDKGDIEYLIRKLEKLKENMKE